MKQTQQQAVLEYLETGHTLTRTQATCLLDIANLSAVISDLRKSGNKIESISIGGGNVTYELDTNAEYEREFFELLKNQGVLDEYIEHVELVNKGEFRLESSEWRYVSHSFVWPWMDAVKWSNLSTLWRSQLATIKNL
jgi:hypothetical protein